MKKIIFTLIAFLTTLQNSCACIYKEPDIIAYDPAWDLAPLLILYIILALYIWEFIFSKIYNARIM